MSKDEIFQCKMQFLDIQFKYLYKAMTDINLMNMQSEYDELFYRYRLTNFKYVLKSDRKNGIIAFEPIGIENKLILRGILA